MFGGKLVAVLAATTPVAAHATSELATGGPVPSWVKPVSPNASPQATGDQAAVRVMLQDQQVDLQPGRMVRYTENVVRIQTPPGLAAGNVVLAWNPDTDTPTVHRLVLRRGNKTIDLLASQKFTIVRRESNLENAVIDGVLTATLQPEGLQVGDVIDFQASIAQSDPAFGHHVEQISGGWNGVPVGRAHMLVRWPAAVRVQTRTTPGLPALKVERKDGISFVETTLDDLPPLPAPKGAPARYGIMRVAEFSDFASWAELAALMIPLYAKASALTSTSALAEEMKAIAAKTSDPKLRAQAALELVQDRVRYVFLGMNDGGLVPADAETTWQRRFGDCKGKTAMLLALLHGLGIEADPVIASSVAGDAIDERLPMIALFNHVLVRATIADRTYWLDGTRIGDRSLDDIRTPDFRWGLPLVRDAHLVRLDASVPAKPLSEASIRIDASGGITLPAPTEAELIIREDAAVALNQQLSNLEQDALDRGLRDFWRQRYDFVTVKSAAVRFDPVAREERLTMSGDAAMSWNNGWYEADGVGVGYKADFTRDPGPNRDAPFAVAFPYAASAHETIMLPPGNFRIDHGDPVDTTVAGIHYRRTASLTGNRFDIQEDEVSVARAFPADQATAAQAQLRALAERNVFIGRPDGYRQTDAELREAMRTTPTTADAFLDRGNQLIDRHRFAEAIDDFTKAMALNPKSAWAYADRGLAYAYQDRADAAEQDLVAAEKLDPRNRALWNGRAVLADRRGAAREAIAAYSRSLDSEPRAIFALTGRARARHLIGDDAGALSDVNAVIEQSPQWTGLYLMRANIYRALGRSEDALAQAPLASRVAGPTDGFTHVVAARIYARFGHDEDAAREFAAALAIQPAAYIYVNRARTRPITDFASRQADLDAAAKLGPKDDSVVAARAKLLEDRREFASAVNLWTAAVSDDASNPDFLIQRGLDQQRLGRTAEAAKDFADARAAATTPDVKAAICREMARGGAEPSATLSYCQAVAKTLPGRPDILGDLGMAALQAGALSEASSALDQALSLAPGDPAVKFERALVIERRGDTARAASERASALRTDPGLSLEFSNIANARISAASTQ